MLIREMLQKRFPNVKFVPYTEMPPVPHGAGHVVLNDKILELIREKRGDAVLVGNGG